MLSPERKVTVTICDSERVERASARVHALCKRSAHVLAKEALAYAKEVMSDQVICDDLFCSGFSTA
jgi:hypothetical protein